MTGLETNVLVRYIMQDDAKQSARATEWVEALTVDSPGFVPLVAVIEFVWVLSSAYGLDRSQLAAALEGLLRIKELVVGRAETVWKAVRAYQGSAADFADCIIERAAAAAGCVRTVTFDKSAAKSCGMTLIA